MIDKFKISKSILIKINSQIATRTSAKKISEQLEGKILSIHIKNTSRFFNVIMNSNELNPHTITENYDVQISGSVISFAKLLRNNSPDALRDGTISINGDVAVAQKFQKLFAMIKPDIDEELSHFVGDIMANNIVTVSKKTGILKDLPKTFDATRYHSLIIDKKSLSKDLEITAETKDGLIMGIRHKKYPVHGVQFHPESIKTKIGIKILKNFIKI